MAAGIIDGKAIAEKIRAKVKAEVARLKTPRPGLAAIIVGENPASKVYVDIKRKTCDEVGVYSELYKLPEGTAEQEWLHLIDRLNSDKKIHAILVQLPLPPKINEEKVLAAVAVEKDVDGFSPVNIGRLMAGKESAVPCTPKGVIRLLEEYRIGIAGKNAVVIGRSKIVGRPTALLLLNRDATVTICHSKTKNLENYTRNADILVVAIGKPKFVTADMVKAGAAVIDVGINRIGGRLVCDVDYEQGRKKRAYINPVH